MASSWRVFWIVGRTSARIVGDLLARACRRRRGCSARTGRARAGRGSRRRSRRGRGRPRPRSGLARGRCWRVPTVTAGVPRNAPSRSAADELPTMHAQCAISLTKISGGRLRKKWKPCASPSSRKMPQALGDLLGAGVDVRPEDERLHPERRDRLERRVDLVEPVPVLGRDRVLHHQHERLLGIDPARRRRRSCSSASRRQAEVGRARRGRSRGSRR